MFFRCFTIILNVLLNPVRKNAKKLILLNFCVPKQIFFVVTIMELYCILKRYSAFFPCIHAEFEWWFPTYVDPFNLTSKASKIEALIILPTIVLTSAGSLDAAAVWTAAI